MGSKSKFLLTLNVLMYLSLSLTGEAKASDELEFETFLQQRQSEFSQYEKQQKQEVEAFISAWRAAEKAYLEKVSRKWQDPNLPNSKTWVQYSDDLNKRTSVNFERGEVTVELLNAVDNEHAVAYANQQLTELSELSVTKTLSKDPIYIAVNHNFSRNNKIIRQSGKMPNKLEKASPNQPKVGSEQTLLAQGVVNDMLSSKPIVTKHKDRVRVSFKLPPSTLSRQAKRYLPEVQTQAARYNLESALLLAIIHTESSFNPLARSPVPAFGLMQIVPTSAGKDVSSFLQGKPLLLSPEYLYQAANNVEAGSTYVYLLSNRYFKNVRDERSRIYLSIAAYNTGLGNVAKTISGSSSLEQATIAANAMSPERIFALLVNNLPAKETRDYLQKVVQRTAYYQEQLQGI